MSLYFQCLLAYVCNRERKHQGAAAHSRAWIYTATLRGHSPGQIEEIPTPTSLPSTWEIISSSCTLPNLFYYLVTHWLSLSICSPPLQIFFSQGIRIFLYTLPHCPLQNTGCRKSPHSSLDLWAGQALPLPCSFFGHDLFNLPPTGMWTRFGHSCLQSFAAP